MDMKKVLMIGLSGLLVLSSCGTAAGTGAYVGGQFGHVIGSAVGGISGGPRGHDVGSLVGTIGGAVAGAAIGSAVDKSNENKYNAERAKRENDRRVVGADRRQQRSKEYARQYDDSGFDPQGLGDDRISFDDDLSAHIFSSVEVCNVHYTDASGDGILMRKEECQVTFDIMNNTEKTLHNIKPSVTEVTGNKHVRISPNRSIETIRPGQGVRYTATVLADGRLKDGEVVIRIGVAQNNRELTSQTEEFSIPTRKKL